MLLMLSRPEEVCVHNLKAREFRQGKSIIIKETVFIKDFESHKFVMI